MSNDHTGPCLVSQSVEGLAGPWDVVGGLRTFSACGFCLFNVLLNRDVCFYIPGHARFSFSKAKSAVPTVSSPVPRACCEQRPD